MNALKVIGLIAGVAVVFAVGAEAAGVSEPSAWRAPHVVRIQSERVYSYFPEWAVWISSAEQGEPQGLLLRDGDLIIGDSIAFIYRDADGVEVSTAGRSGIVRVRGTPVTMVLDEIGARGWLDRATTAELAGLRLAAFGDSIPPGLWPATRRLAAANPNIALMLERWDSAAPVLSMFRPALLHVVRSDGYSPSLLADQRQLETLLIKADDSLSLEGLDHLPALRRLLLEDWDTDRTGPLPMGMTSLRSLVLAMNSRDSTLAALRNAPRQLEELAVIYSKDVVDISGVAAFPELRTLVLNGSEKIEDLRPLAGLTKLQWLGLPPATTQEQFRSIVAAHPALTIIDLTDAERIADLSPLKGLNDLQALILSDSAIDLSVLAELKTLRFVAVGVGSKGDSAMVRGRARVAAVRQMLPDALVVPARPYCLGSGWILLLIPAVALSWYAASRARRRPLASVVSG